MSLPETGKGKTIYVGPDELLAYFRWRLEKNPESDYYKKMVKQMEENFGKGEEKGEINTDPKEE